ncbi:hypothetical protein [Fusibacter tunisiensis]|uniref:Energy-coupling factor transport system substrate-specific component n=1 Tax=Fusibacter tunisiensis TaxID=1008308 RepID=A0ABS2MNS3_9FIRM|nr:hypothetical protein [Fusibacter tunisiensis]MBM7561042.1 energy-coupling factor transport system substrate-specific component [Fusibacter tunisiensis]
MKHRSTSILTQIAMAVAAIIVGGYAIYIVSSQVPLPGVKYSAMAPYLSLVMAIVITFFRLKNIVLVVNSVFAMIMTLISPYMGLAIFSTGLATQVVSNLIPDRFLLKTQIVASIYSAFVAGIALQVSKYFIGGAFYDQITWPYVFLLMGIAFVLGLIGGHYGVLIGKRVRKSI